MNTEPSFFAGKKPRQVPPATIDFSGTWTNRLGSEMELTVTDGKITGC